MTTATSEKSTLNSTFAMRTMSEKYNYAFTILTILFTFRLRLRRLLKFVCAGKRDKYALVFVVYLIAWLASLYASLLSFSLPFKREKHQQHNK